MGVYKGVMGGVETMFSAREVPWHYSYNQDRVSLTDLTIESGHQALVLAGCDWGVNLVNLSEFMPDHEGADDYFLTLRSDEQSVLGVHKERYNPIQNQVIAELADAVIANAPGANIVTGGALYQPGKQVWMLVELPDGSKLGGRDVHERYVLIVTSHDGSLSLSIRSTRVRVKCMNTMSMAVNGSRADYVIRHTKNALDYVAEAKAGLAMATANAEAFDARIEQLIDTELDELDFATEFLPQLRDVGERPTEAGRGQTMYDEKFGEIIALYGAPHNEELIGTAWGAVNAVNEYEEWSIKPRGQETHERQMAMLVRGDYPMTKQALALLS